MELRTLNNQHGIALGPILFIIAILAIIAAAIAAGGGSFTASTNTDSAKVLAQAIVDYADQVKTGVNVVNANGCGDLSTSTNQINFTNINLNTNDYLNLYSPSDGSCNVFSQAGGGIMPHLVPQAALDGAHLGYTDYGNYAIYKNVALLNTGQPDNGSNNGAGIDLVLAVPYLSTAVCQQIDAILSGTTTIPTTASKFADAAGSTHFSGNYTTGGGYTTPFSQPSQCIFANFRDYDNHPGSSVNINIAYFLLVAR